MYFRYIANRAGPDDLRRHADTLMRVALVAHLRRDLVFGGGIEQQACFPRRAGKRLFDVDVLAALHGVQADGGMHVIGYADGAGVDVLAFLVEHDAEIFVFGRFVELAEVLSGALGVDVAKRNDVLGLGDLVEDDSALSAAADGSDVELVVERLVAESFEGWDATVAGGGDGACKK